MGKSKWDGNLKKTTTNRRVFLIGFRIYLRTWHSKLCWKIQVLWDLEYLQDQVVHVMDSFWRAVQQNAESTRWLIYYPAAGSNLLSWRRTAGSIRRTESRLQCWFTPIATHLSGHKVLLNLYVPNYKDQNLRRETWSCAISLFFSSFHMCSCPPFRLFGGLVSFVLVK